MAAETTLSLEVRLHQPSEFMTEKRDGQVVDGWIREREAFQQRDVKLAGNIQFDRVEAKAGVREGLGYRFV